MRKNEKKYVYLPTRIEGDKLIVGGAGRFQEDSLVLDKEKAIILLTEIWKFLELSNTDFLISD